jgi:hypothetical protein
MILLLVVAIFVTLQATGKDDEAKSSTEKIEAAQKAAEIAVAEAKAEAAAEKAAAKKAAEEAKAAADKAAADAKRQLDELTAKADKAIADAKKTAEEAAKRAAAPVVPAGNSGASAPPPAPPGFGFKVRHTVERHEDARGANFANYFKEHVKDVISLAADGTTAFVWKSGTTPITGHVIYYHFPGAPPGYEYLYKEGVAPEDARIPIDTSRLTAAGYKPILVDIAPQPGDLLKPGDKVRWTLAWHKDGPKPSPEEVARLTDQG